jgi:hypothetical protein
VQRGSREHIFLELIRFVLNMRKVKIFIEHKEEVSSPENLSFSFASATHGHYLLVLNKQKSKSYRGGDVVASYSLVPFRSANRLQPLDLSDNVWTRSHLTPSRK